MTLFVSVIVILFVAVALSRLAYGLSIPYPSMLALGGTAIALVPGVPAVGIEPDLALAVFVAPVLLDAAYDTSPRDLKENWTAITGLVLVAVCVTTAAVAVIFHALVPGIPWVAAIALGAIVAPPDASAATAVLSQVKLPRRLVLILEGESLFNDATALLILGLAVTLSANAQLTAWSLAPAYAGSIAVSVIAGIAFGWLYPRVSQTLRYPPAAIVIQFAATFAVWIFAQSAGLSPILTIVAYGMTIARFAPRTNNPFTRVQSYAVWDTVVFLLNILAFVLVGLQLRQVLVTVEPGQYLNTFLICGAVLATVIVIRIAWVMTFNAGLRWKNARFGVNLPKGLIAPTFNGGLVLSWCGMRGLVTLAAALSLPADFPGRGLIQLVAFTVVVGTLVFQGLTLGPLIARLTLLTDDRVEREIALARTTALKAALASIDGNTTPYADALRVEYNAILDQDENEVNKENRPMTEHERLRVDAVSAARDALFKLRDAGDIGDDAFHRIEEALDRTELYAVRYRDTGHGG